MLYPNGQRTRSSPITNVSGLLVSSGAMQYGGICGARFNRFVSGEYSKVVGSVPSGYGADSYIMAQKSGGLAGFCEISLKTTSSGVLGFPIYGQTAISLTFADATGQLIVGGVGAAALAITVLPTFLSALLNGIGAASLSFTISPAQLTAKASAVGAASFSISGSLAPYAIGSMYGSTVDSSVLTVNAIAAGVLAAATTTPIHADIRRVNGYEVVGNGKPGTQWGPA